MIAPFAEFAGLLLIIFVCSLAMSLAVERLADRWGANFTGSILLGLVTVLPEYLFVFWAIQKGAVETDLSETSHYYGMAIGSVCGAAAMLVTLGYGLVILTSTSRFSRKPVKTIELSSTTRIDAVYLFATAVIAVVLGLIGNGLGMIDAAILTVVYLGYAIHLYWDARQKSRKQAESGHRTPVLWPLIVLLICGIVVLVVSKPFVVSMKGIATVLGVSPLAIAVILSPIASEMPEKLTAFLTVRRDGKLAEISVCNFMGSKVNHNSLLLAMMPLVVLIYAKDGFFPGIVVPAFWMMTGLTLLAGFSLSLGRLRHWQGWFFISLFLLQILIAFAFPDSPLVVGH